jgi:prevent-host-death family protein
MSRAISAAQANREFSSLLRQVRQGQSFVVTSHGRPVARIVPATSDDAVVQSARAALFERLSRAKARPIRRWRREELYERGSR